MEIKTNRLLMIPCTPESYKTFSGTYKMGPHIEMHLDELKNNIELKGWGVWFVINQDPNSVIGDAGFKGKPNDQKVVEIGYGINPDAQNNGFATEAVNGIKDWAFASGKVNKIVAECSLENIASIRVLEKLGMRRTFSKEGFIYWELPHKVL
ncbi:GNAT family N-acetyltransferase [Halobacillus massiliensis]|uniref:GNAT family N-acetyltransferase n=1 Tax=Halobacillus massiliensis TaxID=1926286 RepID=UPI0009E1B800|nr:GNAT family N-acetyltransferase [Halobacillus massiliensis]